MSAATEESFKQGNIYKSTGVYYLGLTDYNEKMKLIFMTSPLKNDQDFIIPITLSSKVLIVT